MSEETGQKRTREGKFQVNITIDWDASTISVTPASTAQIGEILDALLLAYNTVMETGQELVDEENNRMIH